MDESGRFTSPAPSTFNYMSVPAKIELSSGGVRGAGGYSTNAEGQGHMDQTGDPQTGYRPMKVRVYYLIIMFVWDVCGVWSTSVCLLRLKLNYLT